MFAKIAVTLLALCLCQAFAKPSRFQQGDGPAEMLPQGAYGDLNMPGFTELNTAVNLGLIDLSTALTRLPAYPTTSLSAAISQFFDDLIDQCTRRDETTLSASLMTLRAVSSEFQLLAFEYQKVPETWDMLIALRELGIAEVTLRTQVADTTEMEQGPITLLINEVKNKVNSLPDYKGIALIKIRVNKLVKVFDEQYSLQVADSAQVMRIVAGLGANILNYRPLVTSDMGRLFDAVVKHRVDLENAVYFITQEVSSLAVEFQQHVESSQVMEVAILVSQIDNLMTREIKAIAEAVSYAKDAGKQAYDALNKFL